MHVVGQHLQILVAEVRHCVALDGLELNDVFSPEGRFSGTAVLKVLAQDSFECGGPVDALDAGRRLCRVLFAGVAGIRGLRCSQRGGRSNARELPESA